MNPTVVGDPTRPSNTTRVAHPNKRWNKSTENGKSTGNLVLTWEDLRQQTNRPSLCEG